MVPMVTPMREPVIRGRRRIGRVAAAAALCLAVACSDDAPSARPDGSVLPTVTVAPAPTSPAVSSTSQPPTRSSTIPVTTPPPPTTAPPPTTEVPSGRPVGDAWTATSPFLGDQPVEFTRAVEGDGLDVYVAAPAIGELVLRCVVSVADGATGWREACVESGRTISLVTTDGAQPWTIDVDRDGGVVLTPHPADWAVLHNGCTGPVGELLELVTDVGVMSSIVCVPGAAFAIVPSVLFQPGPSDGFGAVLVETADGWEIEDLGTSIACDDRCDDFGLAPDDEMFSASLPMPPGPAAVDAGEVVDVRDVTADVAAGLAADAGASLEAAIDAVVVSLADLDVEVPATSERYVDAGGPGTALVVVVQPAADDSIASTTWAVWLTADVTGSTTVVRATAWETCARGVTTGDRCV